jgi:putative membrane protein
MPLSRHLLSPLAATALVLAVLNAASAQQLSEGDREFITTAAEAGHAEVATGQTAAESENAAVAAFGKQMVEEHSKMNDELAALAQKKGVTPPSSADLASQAKTTVTGALPGTTFDEQYVSSQLDDHQETLQLLQNEAKSGQDPELKAFAEKYVPVVQKHIAELHDLQKRPELQ